MTTRLPPLVGFLLRHCALGALAGSGLLFALLAFDVGGFASLIWRSEAPILVIVMLQLAFTVTFGSAAMGSAIFLLDSGPADGARPPESGRHGGLRPAILRPRRGTRQIRER